MAAAAGPGASRPRVCVVGTGISGLSSAWALAKQGLDVTVLESDSRLGGHSLTYPGAGERPAVDLGFQVFNLTTYPYLTAFFKELGVEHEPSDMSFALSVDGGRTEWASHGLSTVFAQRGNALSPSFLRMLREVVRFGKEAPAVLAEREGSAGASETLGAYLSRNGYSARFLDEYLLPTTAAVWSVPNEQMLEFPVRTLVAFMANHHLLDPLGQRPRWRVVTGRSQTYVDAVRAQLGALGARVLLERRVVSVSKSGASARSVEVRFESPRGESWCESFDHVVLATHSDVSARLLCGDAVAPERALCGEVRYQPNRVILHSDASQMPVRREAWASWNVLDRSDRSHQGSSKGKGRDVCVTYWLNHLQNLAPSAPLLLCTLNPLGALDASKVIFETVLDHPVLDARAVRAQRVINEQQAAPQEGRNVWFAGAWLGSGFHEDGIRSAVALATAMSPSRQPPDWALAVGAPAAPGLTLIRGPSPARSASQALALGLFRSLSQRGVVRGHLRCVLPDGDEMCFGRASRAAAAALGEPVVRLDVHDLDMIWKAVSKSDIGLGEAYVRGMFDCDDLVQLFDVLIVNSGSLRDALDPWKGGLRAGRDLAQAAAAALAYAAGNAVAHLRHVLRDNTVAGSRKNIEEHYDLGNAMYKLFLDESMTYSCGVHTAACGARGLAEGQRELALHEAQLMKLDEIIRRAELKPTDHVLEVGCGWGSFAIRAAQTVGCSVTGITISTEQLAEARARVKAAGLEHKVNLIICDYRKMGVPQYSAKKNALSYEHDLAPGCFDKVVSIEMLEAVGHNHLPEYFETLERMLRPGGKAVIQVISIHDDRYAEYCSTSDYIRAMVFPGGHLPCLAAVKWATRETALELREVVDIGPDYAITLRMWRENLLKRKQEVRALGYPESFFRNWEMYFAYCEAGFRQRYILNYHLTFVNQGQGGKDGAAAAQGGEGLALADRFLASADKVLVPSVVGFMAWVGVLALTLDPIVRQLATVAFAATLYASVVVLALPRLDPIMSTVSRRQTRRAQVVAVKMITSIFVCAVVIGLVAFHDVLYTTRLAAGSPAGGAADLSPELARAISNGTLAAVNANDKVHFCEWGAENQACAAALPAAAGSAAAPESKYVIKSPLHFVAAVLGWASVSRLVLYFSPMNAVHAVSLVALLWLSFSRDSRTATSALGLTIVHGVSELHAAISCARQLLRFRGLTLQHAGYAALWRLDVLALLVIRWVPVPVLLHPVILQAPWTVLLPICGIAVRETAVLVKTVWELKEEYENRVNTEELLVEARSRQQLIDSLTGVQSSAPQPQPQRSAVYHGVVRHTRRKVDGVSPAAHAFSFPVWMALIDLAEARQGSAFKGQRMVSADGHSWNWFCWLRSDHFSDGLDDDLEACVRRLVLKHTGRHTTGRVLLLTNLRCFGLVFNPVSVYYCMDSADRRLDAVVLEVSNTPWLEKRTYVLPFFRHRDATAGDNAQHEKAQPDKVQPEQELPEQARPEQAQPGQPLDETADEPWHCYKWKKDFHVSPFFDVFYNYAWALTAPGSELRVKATSKRRPGDAAAHLAAHQRGEWAHQTGDAPTIKADGQDDGEVTFVAGLHLRRAEGVLRHLLMQPLMTFSVLLYIHVHAAMLVISKGVDYKPKPANGPELGIRRLAWNLALFAVAGAWELFVLPARVARRAAATCNQRLCT